MPAVVACPHCNKKYNLPDNLLGKTVKCTECQKEFRTPAPGQASRPAQPKVDPRQQQLRQQAEAAARKQASELKQFGVDGPIRKAPDVFDGLTPMQGTADPLNNILLEDPGFDDADFTLAPAETITPDDPHAAMFENPALASSKKTKKGGKRKKGGKGKGSKREMHPQVKESLDKATMTMLIIGGLIALLFGFFYISAYDDAESELNTLNNIAAEVGGEQMSKEEIDEIASEEASYLRTGYMVGILIGVGFMALGFGVQFFPITCSLLSLIIYLVFEIIITIGTLDLLSISGWLRRIIICGALGSAFKDSLNARYYNQMMEERRKAGKI